MGPGRVSAAGCVVRAPARRSDPQLERPPPRSTTAGSLGLGQGVRLSRGRAHPATIASAVRWSPAPRLAERRPGLLDQERNSEARRPRPNRLNQVRSAVGSGGSAAFCSAGVGSSTCPLGDVDCRVPPAAPASPRPTLSIIRSVEHQPPPASATTQQVPAPSAWDPADRNHRPKPLPLVPAPGPHPNLVSIPPPPMTAAVSAAHGLGARSRNLDHATASP